MRFFAVPCRKASHSRYAEILSARQHGGYYEGYACGHLWLEVDDDIVDFSSGHWVAEAETLYETATDPDDRKLGPVEWSVVPPEFIWQSAHSLKAPWRPRGQQTVGEMWYGSWSGCSPNFGVFDRPMEDTAPLIRGFVADAALRERIAVLPPVDLADRS